MHLLYWGKYTICGTNALYFLIICIRLGDALGKAVQSSGLLKELSLIILAGELCEGEDKGV